MLTVYYEWASLLLRWTHVVSGIAWIGSSFYFMHLDAAIKGVPDIPAGKGGEAWEVHGGGFYQVRKYLVAPDRLPKELIWHKWQAYSTWLSGAALLVWVYYLGAGLFLIDPSVRVLAPWQAAAIGIATLALGWVVYDGLVKSALAKNEVALAGAVFAFVVATTWFYQQVFSGRGALIHSGALMGSMMVGNVAMNIMPNQRKVIADLVAGREPNPEYGKQAKTRSRHNNYLTLPVLFLMLSSHFPLTYQTRFAWAIVALALVAGAVIRHFYNERHAGRGDPWWTWLVAALCIWLAIWISATSAPGGRETLGLSPLSETVFPPGTPRAPGPVAAIVMGRCAMCHAGTPSWPGIGMAPKGVRLDSPEAIARERYQIALFAVATRAMPPANVSGITDMERAALAKWTASR